MAKVIPTNRVSPISMSLDKIQELLNKHKLVEGMVHSQHTPRQEIVETLGPSSTSG